MLQMISNVNFINYKDNNILAASKAFANQPQYWKDVAMIFNSDYLKQRRSGLKTDINASEFLETVKNSKSPFQAALGKLLQLGFTPTQIADSFAIATGGATMYRNRVNTLIEGGMSIVEAENEAFIDMQEIAEETQQSARPDKVSQQQASGLGKLLLAFQNTPMQYNRIIKKAALDLVNGRGDPKEHIAKIAYYAGLQNIIFYGLQTALFAFMFDDDEEKKGSAYARTANGMVDTLLRGAGIHGGVIATIKNTILEFYEQEEKATDDSGFTRPQHVYTIIEMLNVSPPIGIKARKINNAFNTYDYNRDITDLMPKSDFQNPIWKATALGVESTLNIPLDRAHQKITNISLALDSDAKMWQRILMFGGWSNYTVGVEVPSVEKAKEELKVIKEERKEQKKVDKAIEKEKEEEVIEAGFIEDQEKEKEAGEETPTCAAVNKAGERCSLKAVSGENFCTVHQKIPESDKGEEVQCSFIRNDKNRCKVRTTNKSGLCYYHD
jgi:hypothetical protein